MANNSELIKRTLLKQKDILIPGVLNIGDKYIDYEFINLGTCLCDMNIKEITPYAIKLGFILKYLNSKKESKF